MTYLAIVPSIHAPSTQACVATATTLDLTIIDNTTANRGVPAAWNLGVDTVLADGTDWLVLLSAGVRFGASGGADLLAHLAHATSRDDLIVEAGAGIGWHCIAFARELLETVGRFDEAFWPGYYEDTDYGYRARLAYGPQLGARWRKPILDMHVAQVAHAIELARVPVWVRRNRAYYATKWGGLPAAETFTSPFGDPR